MIVFVDKENKKHEINSVIYVTDILDETGKFIQKSIELIRDDSRIIWEAIRSCFGSGHWINIKPWTNKEGWRNK